DSFQPCCRHRRRQNRDRHRRARGIAGQLPEMNTTKVTPESIRAMKARWEKIAVLTAYDFPMTRLLDDAGVPLILVGDSLCMVVLGYPDTTRVTMEDMEHHVRAAARAAPKALLAADLPYHSYETAADAIKNARRLQAAG